MSTLNAARRRLFGLNARLPCKRWISLQTQQETSNSVSNNMTATAWW
eukprot:CAMPEP_0195578590 /NCGR_PEP_ID=MMETSP0814-20130614/12327_1 /TAXON_ID=97485 /ORGANISM="Prymnesium parvum, Strain Texoma1" /LENGTH=46 /DNA_ID= /DNA_START= /DNA_END= /DNA_ORIENTATION=